MISNWYEERLRKIGWRTLAALGLFFGVGFTAGFLTGFEYGFSDRETPPISEVSGADAGPSPSDEPGVSAPAAPPDAAQSETTETDEASAGEDESGGDGTLGGEFALTEHALGDDENGLFISGTVVNQSQSAFDAARIAFELCDAKGVAYTTVADRTNERMEPGDSWGFVVYIPYSEMKEFHSYRLQGIMGVRR